MKHFSKREDCCLTNGSNRANFSLARPISTFYQFGSSNNNNNLMQRSRRERFQGSRIPFPDSENHFKWIKVRLFRYRLCFWICCVFNMSICRNSATKFAASNFYPISSIIDFWSFLPLRNCCKPFNPENRLENAQCCMHSMKCHPSFNSSSSICTLALR